MSDSQSHTRKQVLWSILGYAFPALSSLFLTPFVVRGLGEVRYGLFLLCMTTIGFLSVLELGLAGAAVHELARARADEHPKSSREVFSTVLALFVVLACVGAATLLIGADVAVERIFKIAEGDRADALICLRLAAAGLFFNLAMVPFVSFIRAAERFDVQSKVGMCVSVFSGLGTFWRGSQGDLIGALLFPLTGSLITATSLAIACRRVDPLRATLTLPSRAVLHDLWRFASFQLLSRICGAVGQEIGKLVLASRYGTGQLTWFSVPFTLMQRVQRLLGTASAILFPRIARLSKSGDSAQVSETYRRAQKALIPVAIAMTVPLGAAAKPFLSAWISPEFADHAWQPMTVVAVAFAISGAGVGFVQTLLGLGQSRSVFYIEVCHVIINTSLLFPLTGMFGVTGAALSYLAGWLSLGVGQWVVSKHLGADASRGIGKLLAVTAILTAPVAVAVHVTAAQLTPLGVLGPLSAAGLGTCTILGGLALSPWAFGQDAAIAHELRGAPGRLLARLRRRG